MRGWQPSIAMTRVVPERSAPIMKTGLSFSVMGILSSLSRVGRSGLLHVQVAQPGEEVDKGLAGRLLEAAGHADLLQDRLAALGGVEGDDGGAQPLHLRRGD